MSNYRVISEIEHLKQSCNAIIDSEKQQHQLKRNNSTYSYNYNYNNNEHNANFNKHKHPSSKDTRLHKIATQLRSVINIKTQKTKQHIAPPNSTLQEYPQPTPSPSSNPEYLYSLYETEKNKNTKLTHELSLLHKKLSQLESALHNANPNNTNNNEHISSLIAENNSLRTFKANVYAISQEYDSINENIIQALSEIHDMIKNCSLNNVNIKYENVIEQIINTMKLKQEEYNLLLNEKEKENEQLHIEIMNSNNKIKQNTFIIDKEYFAKTAKQLHERRKRNYKNQYEHSYNSKKLDNAVNTIDYIEQYCGVSLKNAFPHHNYHQMRRSASVNNIF